MANNITCGARVKTQNATNSKCGIQEKMQCDLTSVDNLLRLFSAHVTTKFSGGAAFGQIGPIANTTASSERGI
jgi:hypothetical protein